MKFNFFHSMPWTHYEGVPESWPVSSGNFDGPRGKLPRGPSKLPLETGQLSGTPS